jgi:hypothetical protein
MPRAFFLAAALLAAALSCQAEPAAAQDGDMQWQFFESNDPDNKGAMIARLVYGVPETDNVQVMGVGDARPSTNAQFANLTFAADIGGLTNGADAALRFSGGGFEQTLEGLIQRAEGEGLSGVNLDIKNDDQLWAAFAEKETLDYSVPGYRAATLNLAEGRDNLKKFVEACRTYEQAVRGDGAGAEAETAEASASARKRPLTAPRSSARPRASRRSWQSIQAASMPISPAHISTSSRQPKRRQRPRRLRQHRRRSRWPRPVPAPIRRARTCST